MDINFLHNFVQTFPKNSTNIFSNNIDKNHNLNNIQKKVINYLFSQYNSENRQLYNIKYINDMFKEYSKIENFVLHPESFKLAILFHRILFSANNFKSEINSADFFKSAYKGLLKDSVLYDTFFMICNIHTYEESPENDFNLFMDLTRYMFSLEREEYIKYMELYMREYRSCYNRDDYFYLRKEKLEEFLQKKSFYFSDIYKCQNDIAKENIIFELNAIDKFQSNKKFSIVK